MIKRRKLHAYHSSTYDDDGLRQFRSCQGIRAVPNSRIVLNAGNRRHKIRRTRTNHQILSLVRLPVTFYSPCLADTIEDFCHSVNDRAMFIIEPLFDTGNEFTDDDRFAFLHRRKIVLHVLCRHSVFLRMRRVIVLFGAIQKRLGRNTTHIQAGSSNRILLKKHYIFTGFGGFFCRCISGRTSSDDC